MNDEKKVRLAKAEQVLRLLMVDHQKALAELRD